MNYTVRLTIFLSCLFLFTLAVADEEGQPLAYKTTPTRTLNVYAYFPATLTGVKNRPAVVLFFGGGWMNGSPSQFKALCRTLSQKGIVCFTPEYRVQSTDATTPLDALEDAADSIIWLARHHDELGINPGRIAVGGISAGGQLAAALAVKVPILDKQKSSTIHLDASILINPVIDNGPNGLGYGYSRVKDYWEQFSPFHNVKKGAPSTLIISGSDDKLISPETLQSFCDAIIASGSECKLIIEQGVGHSFFLNQKNPYSLKATEQIEQFLTARGYFRNEK